jgi:hypothetical protein
MASKGGPPVDATPESVKKGAEAPDSRTPDWLEKASGAETKAMEEIEYREFLHFLEQNPDLRGKLKETVTPENWRDLKAALT